MPIRTLFFAIIACSAFAFGQLAPALEPPVTHAYQIGYAANLNIGDSALNFSNDGVNGGTNAGNICANVYVFDPTEEEIACCSCLVTPDGLNSISVKNDLISNTLTPSVPSSVVIKLVSSFPATDTTGTPTICNPSGIYTFVLGGPSIVNLAAGMHAWGSTIEPDAGAASFGVVSVRYQPSALSSSEILRLTRNCAFLQEEGSNFGVCKSCRLGGLAGAKQ